MVLWTGFLFTRLFPEMNVDCLLEEIAALRRPTKVAHINREALMAMSEMRVQKPCEADAWCVVTPGCDELEIAAEWD